MADDELPRSWRRTRDALERAHQALLKDDVIESALIQFSEYLEANELELACDELEAIAVQRRIENDLFWRSMMDACVWMSLYERAAYYLDIAKGNIKLDTEND